VCQLMDSKTTAAMNAEPPSDQATPSGMPLHDVGDGGPKDVRLGFRRIGYRLADCEAWAAASTFKHRAAELAHHVAD
jgi:hypothetical protein